MPHPYPYPWSRNRDPLSLPPGLLRHEVQVQQPATTPSSFGASVNPSSWTKVFSVMAGIDVISSRDAFALNQMTSQVTHVIWMPWTDLPVKAGYRVTLQTAATVAQRTFLVQAVENVFERNRVLTLRCLEVNSGQ